MRFRAGPRARSKNGGSGRNAGADVLPFGHLCPDHRTYLRTPRIRNGRSGRSPRRGGACAHRDQFSSREEDNARSIVRFNGVSAEDLTREKAGEVFPDFTGEDNMWFCCAEMRHYKYGVYYSNGSWTAPRPNAGTMWVGTAEPPRGSKAEARGACRRLLVQGFLFFSL